MSCNQGSSKLFIIIVLATVVVINFIAPVEAFNLSQFDIASEPLARLFQILFILFIISPPLIVILLYKIWQELKERNKRE